MRSKKIALGLAFVAIVTGFIVFCIFGGGEKSINEVSKNDGHVAVSKGESALNVSGVELGGEQQNKKIVNGVGTSFKFPHRRPDPEPLPPGNIAKNFEQIKSIASDGNNKISYALAAALFRCGYMSGYKSEKCDGLTKAQINQFPHLLDVAASHGNMNAQINYATLMGVYMQRSDMAFNENAIRAYKRKSLTYLHDAASHGSIDALTQLSMTYADGYLVNKDMEKAYAYTYAVYRTGMSPMAGRLLTKWQKSLTSGQLKNAMRDGDKIYSSCCVN